ncbi:MAG: hypothetical protein AAFV98_09885 [Chloroflexota bacterium]
MTNKHSRRFYTLIGIVFTIVATTLALTLQTMAAPQETEIAQGGVALTRAAATAQAVQPNAQATAQAVQTQAAESVQDSQTSIALTAQVAQTEINATLDSYRADVVATSEALQTEVYATLDVARTEVAATIEGVAERLDDALSVVDAEFDPETNTLRLTTTIDEIQINEAIDIVLAASGYEDVNASVDLIPNGIVVTLEDYVLENGTTATVALTFTLVQDVESGAYQLVLTSATINGIPVPVNQLADELDTLVIAYLEAYLEDIIGGETSDFTDQIPDNAELDNIEVEQVIITNDLIAVVIVMTLQ